MFITLTSLKKTTFENNDFKYVVELTPSFSNYSEIIISKSNGIGKIKITLKNKYQVKPVSQDSTELNKSDFEFFNSQLKGISLKTVKTKLSHGMDGMGINNSYYEKNIKNEFYFWSPAKGTEECKIIESIIGLSERKFTSEKYKYYFEDLKKYYGY